jgi:transcriptional regulator of arginine metabolism
MNAKERRRARILSLIRSRPLHSQEEIASALSRDGLEATQATLSRDLRELGVVKGPAGYATPETPRNGAGGSGLQAALDTFRLSAKAAGTIVVVRTGAGQASALALEIDRAGLPGVAGTVAGDDTVFLACENARAATRVCGKIGGS